MPSRAYTSVLHFDAFAFYNGGPFVSMPSRAYTSFLHYIQFELLVGINLCQCPLGLIPHFYGTTSKT